MESATQQANKRRRIEPITCSNFPRHYVEAETEPSRLMSEGALLGPTPRPQIKSEIELVQLQQQIGDLLRKIPIIEMDNVLEEIFTIDVEDVEGHVHEYDERFAAFFGLNQLELDVKTEPQEQQHDEINLSSDINYEPCTSATARARYVASSDPSQSQPMQPLVDATAIAADTSNNGTSVQWYIDCDEEIGGHTYDEHFARNFGLAEKLPQFQLKKEEDVEPIGESSQTHDADVPSVSIDPIVNASTADSIPEKKADRPIMGMSVNDPISEHYMFDVDVCIRKKPVP